MSKIIKETCDTIYKYLKDEYMSVSTTEEELLKISDQFVKLWNMPHAVGASNRKHVRTECPQLS